MQKHLRPRVALPLVVLLSTPLACTTDGARAPAASAARRAPGSPIDTAPRVAGPSPLAKAYTQHLGQLTHTSVNDTAAIGILGTDNAVSFDVPEGLAFLFGDSWTCDPATLGLDSLAISRTTSVGRFRMPVLEFASYVPRPGEPRRFSPFTAPGVDLSSGRTPQDGFVRDGQTYFLLQSVDPASGKPRSILAHSDGLDPRHLTVEHSVLAQHFLYMTHVVIGDTVYIYGDYDYRKDNLYLAKVALADITDRSKWTYYQGMLLGKPVFGLGEADAVPVLTDGCFGEVSVRHHPATQLYLMTYLCNHPRGILLRTAPSITGPWSEHQTIFDPDVDGGYEHFMHASEARVGHDDGLGEDCVYYTAPWHDQDGGEYAPYLTPRWFHSEGGVHHVVYTLSSWNPYQVHLMDTVLTAAGSTATKPEYGAGLPRASLVNGDFATGDVRGWQTTGDGSTFRTYSTPDGKRRLTTYTKAKGDAAIGSIYQDFAVDSLTAQLAFSVCGGAASVKLVHNGDIVRKTVGRQTCSVYTEAVWDLTEFQGEVVRLVVEDDLTTPWGFIDTSGFGLR